MIDTSLIPAVWYNALVRHALKDSKESIELLDKLQAIHESKAKSEEQRPGHEAQNCVEWPICQ